MRSTSTPGLVLWSRRLGALSASTPAVVRQHRVRDGPLTLSRITVRTGRRPEQRSTATSAGRGTCRAVRVLTLARRRQAVLRQRKTAPCTRSTQATGSVVWTYHAAGAVKASPSLSGGVLYFGDYSGELQAVGESNGHDCCGAAAPAARCSAAAPSTRPPAIIYGSVFLGNTDGRVYAYDASSGALDWAVQTGAYVYASPAVTNAPVSARPSTWVPTTARSTRSTPARGTSSGSTTRAGKISGSATILGNIVYFADLGTHRTIGLGSPPAKSCSR